MSLRVLSGCPPDDVWLMIEGGLSEVLRIPLLGVWRFQNVLLSATQDRMIAEIKTPKGSLSVDNRTASCEVRVWMPIQEFSALCLEYDSFHGDVYLRKVQEVLESHCLDELTSCDRTARNSEWRRQRQRNPPERMRLLHSTMFTSAWRARTEQFERFEGFPWQPLPVGDRLLEYNIRTEGLLEFVGGTPQEVEVAPGDLIPTCWLELDAVKFTSRLSVSYRRSSAYKENGRLNAAAIYFKPDRRGVRRSFGEMQGHKSEEIATKKTKTS